MGRFVIMGVSGCGKTSVGHALAKSLGLTFIDGDDLHPQSNIEKMASGVPLTDADRAPCLAAVGQALAAAPPPAAIGCSSLKRAYRDILRAEAGAITFLHLHTAREVLAKRMAEREGHFMPAALLDSQLATLEPLEADEAGVVIDIARPLSEVAAEAERHVKARL